MTENTPPQPDKTPEPQTFSLEYVRELRAENKGWRLKASENEAAATTAKAAADRAAADADKRIADAMSATNSKLVNSELKILATKAGMLDLDGLKLADTSKVKLLDDGSVEGADALIASLKEAKPYLFVAQSSAATGTTASTASAPKPAAITAKHAKDMSPEEYLAAKRALGIA